MNVNPPFVLIEKILFTNECSPSIPTPRSVTQTPFRNKFWCETRGSRGWMVETINLGDSRSQYYRRHAKRGP